MRGAAGHLSLRNAGAAASHHSLNGGPRGDPFPLRVLCGPSQGLCRRIHIRFYRLLPDVRRLARVRRAGGDRLRYRVFGGLRIPAADAGSSDYPRNRRRRMVSLRAVFALLAPGHRRAVTRFLGSRLGCFGRLTHQRLGHSPGDGVLAKIPSRYVAAAGFIFARAQFCRGWTRGSAERRDRGCRADRPLFRAERSIAYRRGRRPRRARTGRVPPHRTGDGSSHFAASNFSVSPRAGFLSRRQLAGGPVAARGCSHHRRYVFNKLRICLLAVLGDRQPAPARDRFPYRLAPDSPHRTASDLNTYYFRSGVVRSNENVSELLENPPEFVLAGIDCGAASNDAPAPNYREVARLDDWTLRFEPPTDRRPCFVLWRRTAAGNSGGPRP